MVARVSPRTVVRLAVVDDTGRATNSYASLASIDGPCPDQPWAMLLADEHQRFWLLGFDLDAKLGDVAGDVATLTDLLDELGIEHTVCASGPTGGRHVWLSLIDPISAAQIRSLAYTARQLLPTLDITPLTNPGSGCLRPPGSPHRFGGHSEILAGPIGDNEVLRPAVTAAQVDALHQLITAAAPPTTTAAAINPPGTVPVPIDSAGAEHLAGTRRQLPPASARALTTVPTDPSAAMWTVFLGAVRARWHRDDILTHLNAPGMEHLRTANTGPGQPRALRTPQDRRRILERQWHLAVHYIARTAPTAGEDPTFPSRAAEIGDLVDAVQTRADASPGRWIVRGGPSTRRVLDALCLLVATAVTPTVEADTRRLALMTGLGRETVRVRLRHLAETGWIRLAVEATGRRAHHWTLRTPPPPASASCPQSDTDTRSQGVTPPPSPTPPTMLRDHWLPLLRGRLSNLAHDLWTTAGLGHHAAQVHQAIQGSVTVTQLVKTTYYALADLCRLLDILVQHRLVTRDRRGRIRRAITDRRDKVAYKLGAAGIGADRADRYTRERALWSWWMDELEWMRLPGRDPAKKRYRRISIGQLGIDTGRPHGPMPRTTAGLVDHSHARAIIDAA